MDESNKENTLYLIGENQGKSPPPQDNVVDNAARRITREASKGKGIDSDSEDVEEPEVVTMESNGTRKQGGRKGAPKSSKNIFSFTIHNATIIHGAMEI